MDKKYLNGAIAIAAALACGTALADSAGLTPIQNAPVYTFSAFGTLGAVQTNTDNGTYTTGFENYGATKTVSFATDSKLGGQLDAHFNDSFSATLQLFSKQNAIGTYEPDVEWAFGKLKLGEGFDLRLGRMGAPFFMTSDFRNVGYTNLTVRTPIDVYQMVPIRSFDGGDILYKTDLGGTSLNGQIWLGKSSVRIGQNAQGDEDIILNNIAGINFSAETGPFTFRLGSMKSRLGSSGSGLNGFNALLAGLNKFGALPELGSLETMSDEMAVNGKFQSFTGAGLIFDQGNWVVNAEYVMRKSASTYVPTMNAWYATLGYRIDTFTPYVSYSTRDVTSTLSYATPAIPPTYPAVVQHTVPVLVSNVNGLLNNTGENTTALGVRWDAGKNYDVKAEFEQIRVPAGSVGQFKYISTGSYLVDTKVNVVSLVVDFVF